MFKDPIVEEVRRSGEKLAAAVGYDRNKFIERLRQNQKNSNRKVVSFAKKRQDTSGAESR
jgi:hypothetical protein